ncbi:MAG: ferritin family protein [Planctomycetota bacterium]|jgi:rubrerythrin
MIIFRSGRDVLEFAIAREVESYEFYMESAEQVEDPMLIKAFEYLAQEELKHKGKLELEVMKTGRVVATAVNVVWPEAGDYTVDIEPEPNVAYQNLLNLAMQKEKASLRFYINLAATAENKNFREMLLSLAEEEARHKALLEIKYDDILLKEN